MGDPAPIADHVDYFSPIGLAGFTASTNGVVAYHATENSSQLLWVNRNGMQTGSVGPIGNYDYIRLSPDGTRLALDIRDSRTNAEDVHVLDLTRGAADTRITSAIGGEFAPIWSPDGKRLVFSWDRDAPPYLHQVALNDLGSIAPISRPSFPQIPGDWHPSGSHVAFEEQTRETGSNVVVLDISGAGKATPFVNTRFNETSPRFSPDGRWMAYVSDEAGTPDVYVRPFPGPGEAHRISSGGGANPRWRRDGRELFFVAGQQVMAVAVSAAQRFAAGTPIARFDRKPARIIDYDVARDGQSFLINSEITGPETKPITVVVNWPAMLATR
jgi:Tol biopolymer transport system component